ncbi:MAG TPA: hypothetical protein DCW42_04545 [Bacteroidetes bacterium]|nr:hypothetical protein [Bacteroidota bacterium]
MIDTLLIYFIIVYFLIGTVTGIGIVTDEIPREKPDIVEILGGILLFIIILFIWPIFAYFYFNGIFYPRNYDKYPNRVFDIPSGLLIKKISIQEAESENISSYFDNGTFLMPFGRYNPVWNEMKANMFEGDEVWEFSTSSIWWENLCGSAGVCIIRNGQPIDAIITMKN